MKTALETFRERVTFELAKKQDTQDVSRILKHLPPEIDVRLAPVDDENGGDTFDFARVVKALCHGWGHAPGEREVIQKSLGSSAFSGGGVLVPTGHSKKIISTLNANSVVKKLGVPTIPMTEASLEMPRIVTNPSVAWTSEDATQSEATNPTFGQVTLTAKDLSSMIYVKNNLIEDCSPSITMMIEELMAEQLALELDRIFFLGSGVAPEPLGLINHSGINEPDSGGIAASSLTESHFSRLITSILNDNGSVTGLATTPQVWHYVKDFVDGNGRKIAGDGDITKGIDATLYGYPVYFTTQLANTAGTTHYVAAGAFKRYAVVGERRGVTLKIAKEVRFVYNETAIKMDMRVDTRLLQPAAFGLLQVTGVTTL